MAAERALMNEYKSLSKEAWTNISLINDNIYEWSVAIIPLATTSLYYGGYYKAKLTFPKDYPYTPPTFAFTRPLYHPNIYSDGKICISILHAPGDDEMSGETAAERWNPTQRVESVLISILSMLEDPNISSPANVDASVLMRKDPEAYKAKVQADVEQSKKDIPAGFVLPTSETAFANANKGRDDEFDMSWDDSDVESFGGSESDAEDDEDEASEESDDQEEMDEDDD